MELIRRKDSGKAPPATSQKMTAEEQFLPSVEWTTNPSTHVLRIHLPGFKKENLKVVVDGAGKLTVSGRRTAPETKPAQVDQCFDVPKDSDVGKIKGRFEEDHLTVVMPRKQAMGGPQEYSWNDIPLFDEAGGHEVGEKRGAEEKTTAAAGGKRLRGLGAGEDGLHREDSDQHGFADDLLEKVSRNKKVIAVAVAAFAVGFYVSHRLRSRA